MSLSFAASSAAAAASSSLQLPPSPAAQQHDTATSNINPTHSHSSQAEPPSQRLLTFLETPAATQRYSTAILPFLSLHKELEAAKESLEKFKAACNKHNADRPSLPQSLKLSIVERARLPNVEGKPDLFKDELKELQAIELEATKRTVQVLLRAKEKHIAELQSKVNAQSFKQRASDSYTEFLTLQAQAFDELHGADSVSAASAAPSAASSASSASASSSSQPPRFPFIEAQLHFQQYINSKVDAELFLLMHKRQERTERKRKQHEESIAAKEQILQGASSGQTLSALATRAANKAVAPLQSAVHRLTERSKRQKLQHTVATVQPLHAANSQPKQHKQPQHAPRRNKQPSSHSTPSSAPPPPPPVPAQSRNNRSALPSTAAHTTQHAEQRNRNRGAKRNANEHTEQRTKRERVQAHHPESRTNSPRPHSKVPSGTVQHFPQGGDRRRPQQQRSRQQRSNPHAGPQRESGHQKEKGDRRQ